MTASINKHVEINNSRNLFDNDMEFRVFHANFHSGHYKAQTI